MLDASTFAYHTEAPFELAVLSERVQDGARIQDVAFKSPLTKKNSSHKRGGRKARMASADLLHGNVAFCDTFG